MTVNYPIEGKHNLFIARKNNLLERLYKYCMCAHIEEVSLNMLAKWRALRMTKLLSNDLGNQSWKSQVKRDLNIAYRVYFP